MKVIISTKKYDEFIDFVDACTIKDDKSYYIYNVPDKYVEKFTEEIIDISDNFNNAFNLAFNC